MSSNLIGLLGACALVSLSLVAGCALDTVVQAPPPQDKEEALTAAPSPEHFWVRGSWQWNGHDYLWAPGHWEVRRADASWKAGHWRNVSGGWVWVEGRWAQR